MKKPKALDEMKAIIVNTLDVDLDREEVGRRMTNVFDLGARAGMTRAEVEAFILVTTNREVFRRTGRLI